MLLLTGGDDMQSCVCDVGNLVMVGLQRTSRVLFCLQLRTGNRVAARIFAAAAFGCLWLCPVTDAVAASRTSEPASDPFAEVSPPGVAERGGARSAELYCAVCHGPNGNSETPEWPSLAGQHAGYIAGQLALFRARARSSAEMTPVAQTLSDADIADLAVYYAAQIPKRALPDQAFAAGGGEELYMKGDAARGLAPCASCHGAAGAGNSAAGSPGLRGQSAKYIDSQLTNYARGLRYPAQGNGVSPSRNTLIMTSIASQLTPAENRAIASYIQRLD